MKQRTGSGHLDQSRTGDSQSHLRFPSWSPRYKETKFVIECVRIYNILYTPIRNGFRRKQEILRKILTNTDLHKIRRRFRRASAEWFHDLPSTTLWPVHNSSDDWGLHSAKWISPTGKLLRKSSLLYKVRRLGRYISQDRFC